MLESVSEFRGRRVGEDKGCDGAVVVDILENRDMERVD